MNNCIFCKIIDKSIPAKIIYEDQEIIAFQDIHPKAEIHYLVIPKLHIESMLHLENQHSELMGKIMLKTNTIARESGLQGYKININTGVKGGQEVFHLHLHLLGNK
jgi:histidine triad (HIT) family protein